MLEFVVRQRSVVPMKRRLAGLVAATICAAAIGAADTDYVAEVEKWREARRERLMHDEGWLTVIGLHFLESGANPIGAAADNKIVLASGPAHLGTVTLNEQGVAFLTLNPASGAVVDGQQVLSAVLREGGARPPTRVTVGTLSLFMIDRGGRKALRVRDTASERRRNFAGIEYFPIDPAWRVEAEWVPFAREKEVLIRNVLGQEMPALIPGKAVFERGGKTFELLPLIEGPEEPMMFVIADATSGDETYGGGRFLYADPPRNGKMVLDFNRAQNPPCAFTPFSTCPLPPKENRLPIAVTAGEKDYRGKRD